MSIWQKLSSRFRGHSDDEAAPRSGSESPGMTYADLERDKDIKERQLSGVFAPPFGKDASAVEEDE
ncbi:hypothetical protein ACN28E_03295 [Archangium lansingense]|uniref:hypothetical protein n=1 Tax=Archangium lansingense TaxID=2995310 RepID=UPI003B7E168D